MEQNKFYQIKNVTEHEYTLVGCDGSVITRPIQDVDKSASAFTIQDAKDGDVLCCESGWTCIFKALNNHTNTFSSYCFMDSDKWFCNTGSECHTLDKAFVEAYNGEIYPATKEQRDLLFKKMHEAGYEWDAEKKELKKIEQKSAWSEEDEKYLKLAIDNFQTLGNSFLTTWLKSLKDRVRLQNGYNPYKEVVESIAEMCKHYDTASHSGLRDFYDNVKVKCKEAKEFDTMFPQSTWKPSDEQIKVLNKIREILHSNDDIYHKANAIICDFEELIRILEKLREE